MKKQENKPTTINNLGKYGVQSAMWEKYGFSIYKADGYWNYTNGDTNNWIIDGQPFDTRKECVKALESAIKGGKIKCVCNK